MRRVVKVVSLAAALLFVPTVAYASYSLDSGDGYGTAYLTSTAALGWSGTATWRAYASHGPVYVSGKVIFNSYPDHNCGRISDNTYSSFKTQSIACVKVGVPVPSSDAAGIRLCRDRSGLPDPCGGYRRINY